MIIIPFFLCSYIYAQKDYVLVEDDMVWEVRNGNPSGKTFREGLMLLEDHPLEGRLLAANTFEKGDEFVKFRIFEKGEVLTGGSTFGGKNPGTFPIVRRGKITLGFDKALSKYVEIFISGDQMVTDIENLDLEPGLNHIEHYAYYYFGNGYGGDIQCDNLAWDYEVIEKTKPLMLMSEKEDVNEALAVLEKEPCEPDTVWITELDTIYIDRCRPLVSWSGWVSHAQDHFAKITPDSINYGDYYVTDFKDEHDNQLIWSLLGNITAKVHLGSWSLVSSFEAGYNDGPVDWQVRFLGIEKNWNDRFYLQFGPEYRYREWTKWEKVITNYIDPNNFEFQMQGYRAAIFDLGCYLQMELFNLTGDNHARLYYGQGFRQPQTRVELGTSEVKFNFKLEPKKWYLFFGTKYQFMPTTIVESINIPLIDHLSFEPRIGYSIHQNWILFGRYRNIRNRTFEDIHNPNWSLYERQDFGGGLFFQPNKLLGVKNLYAELIISDSHIKEEFKNHYQDTEEELMEVKFTIFYHWHQ
jgi:hypothetical protein